MKKRKLKKISLLLSSVALMLTFAAPVKAATEDVTEQAEDSGVYVFKDAKRDGTVTFIKKWKDGKKEEDRTIPNIEISTQRPEGAIIKYTVTFHGNGLTFADGTTENSIVYTSAGQVLDGQYKIPSGMNVCWYTDASCTTRIPVSRDGTINIGVSKNIDLYAKEATFVMKSGDTFNSLIPDETTAIYFTDEEIPDGTKIIDVDADGDSGVIAWMEGNIMKVSTQINDVKAISNVNSKNMFSKKANLEEIHFDNIDTSSTTNMQSLFLSCSKLKTLDLTAFNTSKVQYFNSMFSGCSALKQVNIESFDTSSATTLNSMFYGCNSIESVDVSNFNTDKVTDIGYMFVSCKTLTTLDLSNLNTKNVWNMAYIFQKCSNLASVNISTWDTSNATTMQMYVFRM